MHELVLVGIGVLLAVFVNRYVLGAQKFGPRGDGRPTSRWIQGLTLDAPEIARAVLAGGEAVGQGEEES